MAKNKGPKLNADLRELVRTNAECYGDKVLYPPAAEPEFRAEETNRAGAFRERTF